MLAAETKFVICEYDLLFMNISIHIHIAVGERDWLFVSLFIDQHLLSVTMYAAVGERDLLFDNKICYL